MIDNCPLQILFRTDWVPPPFQSPIRWALNHTKVCFYIFDIFIFHNFENEEAAQQYIMVLCREFVSIVMGITLSLLSSFQTLHSFFTN